jgi:hypothetical protein
MSVLFDIAWAAGVVAFSAFTLLCIMVALQ